MQACSDNGVIWDSKVINRLCGATASAKHPHRETASEGSKQGKRARTSLEYKVAWVSGLGRAVKRTEEQISGRAKIIL